MTNKKMIRKTRIEIGMLLCMLFLLNAGCIESNHDEGEDFSFTALDNTIKHLSDYRGKVVILDMWATWCGPCAAQMSELRKIYDFYPPNDLEILSIDIDTRESTGMIQQYRETFQDTYQISLDWVFGRDDGTIWSRYQIGGGIPTLCIFDQEGTLYFSHEGVSIFDETPPGYPDDLTRLRPILDELLG